MNTKWMASAARTPIRWSKSVWPALLLLVAATTPLQSAWAQTFRVIHAFGNQDGADPAASLLQDNAGDLYGTTNFGGSVGCAGFGCGVVYKISAASQETVVTRFAKSTGVEPNAGLIEDSAGNFYGTTGSGGSAACGCGTVFRLDSAGHVTVLYSFHAKNDGDLPEGPLLRDAAGNLYGVTFRGGGKNNSGTVFKVDPSGNETVLYRFTGKADGMWPLGALVSDLQGNLYGTTELGGDLHSCGGNGCGTVFRINAMGGERVLYSFTGGADGSEPGSSLVRDSAGNLYGSAGLGGDLTCDAPWGCGVVFKLDASGAQTVLHTFTSETADGYDAIAGLVRDESGNLYGTTYRGGTFGMGTIFKVDPFGSESLLHSFTGGADGAYPQAALILDSSGNLYGTAVSGGNAKCSNHGNGCGVVFEVSP